MDQRTPVKYQLGTALLAGKPGVVLCCRESYFDLQRLLSNTTSSLFQMLQEWPYWKETLSRVVDALFVSSPGNELPGQLSEGDFQWLPPVMYPRKLICIGTNYTDHIAEMGVTKLPRYPYSFLKPATTTLIGCGTPLLLPEQAKLVDWEAELAIVIGQKGRNVRGEGAMACIAGYSILNDVSARDWIAEAPAVGIDWVMQKAFDGFAPMGPLLTPAEFVADPQSLGITLTVNGERKQHSTTANMVFSIQEIIEHLASIMTLEPGDVIATGTPAGVGYGKKPPEYLRAGETMIVEIEELGRLETPVK